MRSGVAPVGAVVTAAVILDPAKPIVGLNDSKNSAKRRLALFDEIKEKALCWSPGAPSRTKSTS